LRGEGGDSKHFPPRLLARMSAALVENLADLHAVDVTRPALAAIGHPQGYVARQVEGWTARYANAKTDEIADIESVARWVNANVPRESGAAVVHNDYKYDNVMLDPADFTRIVAVLDWEMATVGDPLADLGTTLSYWIEPGDPAALAAAIESLLADPDRRKRMGRAGVADARERFSLDRQIADYVALYAG